MIIWINGAFGAGKTTIAESLQKKIDNSYIYDPENIGDFFRANLPKAIQKTDFQDYPEWRQWNIHLLKKIYQEYQGDIIVPMTLYKEPAYSEMFTGLEKAELDVRHFQLEVSKAEILARLEKRTPALYQWGAEHLTEILQEFENVPSEQKIGNENRSRESVVAEILDKLSRDTGMDL